MALLLVVVLAGGGFATYRLDLIPGLTAQVDDLIGGVARTTAPAGAFVDADGAAVPSDGFGAPLEATGPAQAASAAHPYVDPAVDRAALDADLASIQSAFASKDPGAIKAWIHPAVIEQIEPDLQANAAHLDEVATVLGTRRPVFVTPEFAEYEVTDQGTTYTVVYQLLDGHWLLVGL